MSRTDQWLRCRLSSDFPWLYLSTPCSKRSCATRRPSAGRSPAAASGARILSRRRIRTVRRAGQRFPWPPGRHHAEPIFLRHWRNRACPVGCRFFRTGL